MPFFSHSLGPKGGLRLPGAWGPPVPKRQVREPVDVHGEQDGQPDEVIPPVHPHGVQEELGRQEADEQPQGKAEQGAHGGILSHWPEIARTPGAGGHLRKNEKPPAPPSPTTILNSCPRCRTRLKSI